MKKNKGKTMSVILVIILIAGLCIFLYPTVGNLLNRMTSGAQITEYKSSVSEMDTTELDEKLEAARAYNKILSDLSLGVGTPNSASLLKENMEKFCVGDLVCFVSIPQIDVYLPVYSGDAEKALNKGIWLIEKTSLPVGGENTHAVLSGHRGLPSAKLFTNLDKLETGDMFFVRVLDDTLAYEIDSIKTVLPSEAKDVGIVQGEDYVTLVTCTPYAVNTHRLLIRGTRVEYSEEKALTLPHKADTAFIVPDFDVVVAGVLVIALIIVLTAIGRTNRKKKRISKKESNRYFD